MQQNGSYSKEDYYRYSWEGMDQGDEPIRQEDIAREVLATGNEEDRDDYFDQYGEEPEETLSSVVPVILPQVQALPYSCGTCGKGFATLQQVYDHLAKEHGQTQYTVGQPVPGVQPVQQVQQSYVPGNAYQPIRSRLFIQPIDLQERERVMSLIKTVYEKNLTIVMGNEPWSASDVKMGPVQFAKEAYGKVAGLVASDAQKEEAMRVTLEELQAEENITYYARELRLSRERMIQLLGSIAGAGFSAILMALGASFPLAAMSYFATRGLAMPGKEYFRGVVAGEATVDGQPVLPLDVELPQGLPHDIFDQWRFCCYDRLSGTWWPTDYVQVLPYDSNEPYRWVCLDRVTQKIYHANWIKKPQIMI